VRADASLTRRLANQFKDTLDSASVYLPIVLMGILALATYWLVRNTPVLVEPPAAVAARHEPDYFLRSFAVKTFDAQGQLKSEVAGDQARHYPDTDTLEIDRARIRSVGATGLQTVATAKRALSNGDGSEVQLFGDAHVVRAAATDGSGQTIPRLEFKGEFLHFFREPERLKSHQPVLLVRGADQFSADSMDFDNLHRVMELRGRVRGVLVPTQP
jgi:lipopolysaccharide export system protein LptC